MPDAKASGADAGAARSREHNQGNQGRSYTVEQKAAVLRIRRCNATAFYDILGLETVRATCTETEIKKAYRKQSLLTHPDKNGHEHAAEAFKMVSRAFGILGDKEKKEKYDRHGTDPDSRFANAQNATPGFGGGFGRRADGFGGHGHPFGAGGGEEMTPEEMFARFFGGGGGFGGGPFGGGGFDAGPGFVFNFGGGPGVRVHQFGGARPRRRPQEANEQDYSTAGLQNMLGILPIVLFFVFPLLTSLFSGGGDSVSYAPRMNFDVPLPPMTEGRTMPDSKVSYFVDPKDIKSYSPSKLKKLDATAEHKFFTELVTNCNRERAKQQHMYDDASGWFFDDPDKMAAAAAYKKPSCERLGKYNR